MIRRKSDEEIPVTEKPARPVFSHPPDDGAELDAWANDFVNAVLAEGEHVPDDGSPPEG
jgi:hypothetical protein